MCTTRSHGIIVNYFMSFAYIVRDFFLSVLSPISSAPRPIGEGNDNHQMYNHLRRDSTQSDATTVVCGSYDRLERNDSFNDSVSRMGDTSYSRLNCSTTERVESRVSLRTPRDSYDHLERTGSFDGDSPSSFESRSKSLGSNDGRSRFQFSSPPPEDSYNHLENYRRASWSSSPKTHGNTALSPEAYNRLDRSAISVNQQPPANSYDRLDAMQDRIAPKPPPPRKAIPQQATSPSQPVSVCIL